MDRNDGLKSSTHRHLEDSDSGSGRRRWRGVALVVNASRQFRFTLELKKEEEKEPAILKFRACVQVVEAAFLFQEAGQQEKAGNYGIDQERLASITRDHDFSTLEAFGGVEGLASTIKTSVEKGICGDDDDLLKRKNAFGSNTYPRGKGRGFLNFVWDASQYYPVIFVMLAAANFSDIKKGNEDKWYAGGSIELMVVAVIMVKAVSDYKLERICQNLNEEKQNIELEVVRGGRRIMVSIFDLVVGDVVPLKIGDQVPADGILINGLSLAIDESSMTGETMLVRKGRKAPFLMSGCKVADGYGTMLVTSVGMNTEWGVLMASISEDTGEEKPLQVRLNGVASFIGCVVFILVLIVQMASNFTGINSNGTAQSTPGCSNFTGINSNGTAQSTPGNTKFYTSIDGALKVAIVVAAVPVGLPLVRTLTLAYLLRKMRAGKALVSRFSACETMGYATTICSDKTGTLTLNQMTVVEAYVGGEKAVSPNNGSVLPPKVTSLLIEGIAQNTSGSVFVPEGGGKMEIFGSPTEKAILQWGINLGMNFDASRSSSSIFHVFLFNSEKKRGGVALKLPDSEVRIHWKGAAEIVLASCARYIDTNDQVVPMGEDKVRLFKSAIEDMATRSLHCVAIAYRSCGMENVPTNDDELALWEIPEDELVLLAIIGLKDPCRPGVKDAVRLCTKAGIKVCIVTGDNLLTARAIALECGILGSDADATEPNGPNVIEGKEFRALSEVQRQKIADKIRVMGRSSPYDKLQLVRALRKKGHVVAVTGVGANDARALHEADIGFAMGIQGAEVAKESSDIIILDSCFSSVVKVFQWGRFFNANFQKFIQFQLTVNVAALVINVVASVSGYVPLNALQLLWVNLILDSLGALALATEPPTDELMHRPPVGQRELMTNVMWRNILVQALYQVIVLLFLYFKGREILHLDHYDNNRANKVNTLIFNAFVFCQIFNQFNARKPDEINIFKGVTENYHFLGIVGLNILLQVIIVTFLGKFAGTIRLSWKLWLVSIVIGFVSWPLAIVGKLIPVPNSPLREYFMRIWSRIWPGQSEALLGSTNRMQEDGVEKLEVAIEW